MSQPPNEPPPTANLIDAAPSEPSNPNLLDESPIEPQTEANQADRGIKLFVLFFFLLVPPLGIALLAAFCWTLWKAFNA